MYLEILCQLWNHTVQSCEQDTLYGMLNTKATLVLGLPFLIAQFGIEGFYQLWTFQQMFCKNQEPKGKEKESLTGAVKAVSTFIPNGDG